MKNIENADIIVREILNSCGGQKFLHIGAENGKLVQELLSSGMDAYGIDDSPEYVNYANSIMPDRFSLGVAHNLPYADQSFDTTVVLYNIELVSPELLMQAIREIKRVTRRSIYLRISTSEKRENETRSTVLDRNGWEQLFFSEGFRKHPSYYLLNEYEALGRESGEAIILLESISGEALERYPLEALKEERDLHMDMTREAGERSDAHIARYQWAVTFVRPGDTVLDAACGLGYGSYLVQCGTMAAKTIGIDGSNYAIDYANENFVPNVSNLSFTAGMLPEALNEFADNSVDVVISFETLEHISDPETVLKEFHRILTPGGRIIVSVPNDWSDETGEDPNPFHLHVYTLDKLRDQIKTKFDLENITVQSATHYKENAGSKNWVPAKRELYNIAIDINEAVAPPSEWWLAVGMKSPLNSEDIEYRETQYKTFPDPKWNVTAFSRDYKNPWLVRSMVDVGWRLKNKNQLSELTKLVYDNNQDNSADTGAALCVKAYQLLVGTTPATVEELYSIDARVDDFILSKPETPHAIRWMISLHFVMGRLWLKTGLHDKARQAFEHCVAIDPLQFSPLLGNRVVEAHLYLGILKLNAGDAASARVEWMAGIEKAHKALTADWSQSIGDLHNPVEFGLPELSTILDCASNCAYALVNIDSFKDKPWWWLQLCRSPQAQSASLNSLNAVLKSQLASLNKYASMLEGNHQSHVFMQAENAQLLSSLESNNQSLATLQEKYQQLLSTLEDNGEAVSALQDKNDRLWNFLAIIAGCEISDYPAMDKKIEIIRSLYQVFCGNDLAIQGVTVSELNSLLTQNNVLMRERILELTKMPKENEKLREVIAEKDSTIMAQDVIIAQQTEKVAELMHMLNLKEQAIADQAANIQQLNAIMQTRVMRLRNVMLNQPWGARKIIHATYLATSLVTPQSVRRKMLPLNSCAE